LEAIKKTLDNGISVCIFVENPNIQEEAAKIHSSYCFQSILQNTPYPMIPVAIEKGTKARDHKLFKRLLEKSRVPAALSFGYCYVPEEKGA
jgi:acyl-[acyl-carrier-protein]-phospholipid O-acyltransferase/long-chain-fatty-acid--[acyl-carrier-protein] ligase